MVGRSVAVRLIGSGVSPRAGRTWVTAGRADISAATPAFLAAYPPNTIASTYRDTRTRLSMIDLDDRRRRPSADESDRSRGTTADDQSDRGADGRMERRRPRRPPPGGLKRGTDPGHRGHWDVG